MKVVKRSLVSCSNPNGSLKWPTRTFCTQGSSLMVKYTSLKDG